MVVVVKPAARPYLRPIRARKIRVATKKSVTLPAVSIQGTAIPPRPVPQAVTPRAQKVLSYIEWRPGFTVLEYSDLVTESCEFIAAILQHTVLGQWLASTGKVALPSTGARPHWFANVPEQFKKLVPIKAPVAQLKMPVIVKGSMLESWGALGDDIVKMLCHNTSSPNVRLRRLQEMAAHLSQGMAREIEAQKKIKQLQLAAPIPTPVDQAKPKKATAPRAKKIAKKAA